jgi:hypothetical protein
MVIILKANEVNLFVSSVLFVFWYHSPNILDTPCIHATHYSSQYAQPPSSYVHASLCSSRITLTPLRSLHCLYVVEVGCYVGVGLWQLPNGQQIVQNE